MALYAGFHNQIRPLQGGGGDFFVNRQATDLVYKKDMANTFATQFVSGNPKADMQIQEREEDSVKGGIVCKRGFFWFIKKLSISMYFLIIFLLKLQCHEIEVCL